MNWILKRQLVRRYESGTVALLVVGALFLGTADRAHAGPMKRKALSEREVRKDFELICQVEQKVEAPADSSEKAARIAEFLQRKVKSQQAWIALTHAAETRGASVIEGVEKFGLENDCPFLRFSGYVKRRPPEHTIQFKDLIADARLAISPDGSLSADTMTVNTVSVRDARTKALRFAVPFNQGDSDMPVLFGMPQFSADGRRLVIFSALLGKKDRPSLTTVVDLATGKNSTHPTMNVLGGVVSPDGAAVAYSIDQRVSTGPIPVVVKNLETGDERRCEVDLPQDDVWTPTLALAASGRRLAYVARFEGKVTLRLIDPQSCATLHSWESPHGVVSKPSPAFSPNDELVALRSGAVLRIWNVASGEKPPVSA